MNRNRQKKWWILKAALCLFYSLSLWSSELGTFCSHPWETMAIQQNGRIKPLYVHATEVMKYLTGRSQKRKSFVTYCQLSLAVSGEYPLPQISVHIGHDDVRRLLQMEERQKHLPYSQLLEKMEDLRRPPKHFVEGGSAHKSLKKLFSQANLYRDITSGQNWLIPQGQSPHRGWVPIGHLQRAGGGDFSALTSLLQKARENFESEQGRGHLLEYRLARAQLPVWALFLSLLSLAALTLVRRLTLALSLTALTATVQVALIIVRVMISGRAPITNMYETVLFSGLGALLLALFIGHYKREKVFIYLGLAYNVCTLMMMNFATDMLSDSINPLVPVLRDNFWLSTHVTMVIMSYGALALSWVLANTVLIRKYFGRLSKKEELHYADLAYTCLKYGTIMLGAGIILGGVWADYSWGRFWGWDPKETWSLIAFCLYIAILHGRYTGWLPPHRFMIFTAAAFLSIMMAWFGVNYILAAGLHSYGFSEGGAVFLGSFFILQMALLLLVNLRRAPSPGH